MKTVSIIDTTGEIRIEIDVEDNVIENEVFTIESSDYMLEITNTDEMTVSNAMDGYGHNCREKFKDALIEVYLK